MRRRHNSQQAYQLRRWVDDNRTLVQNAVSTKVAGAAESELGFQVSPDSIRQAMSDLGIEKIKPERKLNPITTLAHAVLAVATVLGIDGPEISDLRSIIKQ